MQEEIEEEGKTSCRGDRRRRGRVKMTVNGQESQRRDMRIKYSAA